MECPSAFDPNAGTNQLMESGTSALGRRWVQCWLQIKEKAARKCKRQK